MADTEKIINYTNKKIDFNGQNTSGVQVPDGLITIGATDTYKLLEALNLDWKNISIPWAKFIQRWNSAFPGARAGDNVVIDSSPTNDDGSSKKLSEYQGNLEYAWNNLTNSVDWLRRNYDYLTDNGYIYEENGETYIGIPNWAKNGKIYESEDIADILNYVLWRIINIDYFTAHWDQRNSMQAILRFGIGWTDDHTVNTIGKIEDKQFLNIDDKKYYVYNWSSSNITLLPTTSRNNVSLLFGTEIYNYYKENGGLNDGQTGNLLFPFVVSNSPGNIVLDLNGLSTFPANTINVEDNKFERVDNWTDTNGSFYAFKGKINVIGTGNYLRPQEWFNDYLINGGSSKFDPDTWSIDFDLMQRGGNDDAGNTFSESKQPVSIAVSKSDNALRTLRILNKDLVNVADPTVNIPFYTVATPSEGYEISFRLDYDANYGISGFFGIKGTATEITSVTYDSTSNKFASCSHDKLGTISFRDNKYYFMPPNQPENSNDDKIITVFYAFYYNDTSASRQLKPITGSFNIRLTARVNNRILFWPRQNQQEMQRTKYNPTTNVWAEGMYDGSDAVLNDLSVGSYYNNNDYPVSYCVRTIEYEEILDGRDSVALNFEKFIYTYCSNEQDIHVDYIGYMQSTTATERNIDFANSVVYPDSSNTDISYPILENKVVKVGPDEYNGNFYYSEESVYDYNVQKVVLSNIKERDYIKETADIENIVEFAGHYTTDDANNSDYLEKNTGKYNFKLLQSTAEYPLENGIYKPDDKYVDADKDYFYLVFKVWTPAGSIGSISFTAAEGYYFLRVLRKENTVSLSFIGDTTSEIRYKSANNVDCSFRLMPRTPIYLNRLFTENGQKILKEMTGKFYWQFYGGGDEGEAFQLDPTIVALKSDNEDYIKIYNENDKCTFVNYTDPTPNSYNPNTTYKPENGKIINFDATGTTKVGHFNSKAGSDTSSGAILWVNKLMHATNDDTNPYERIVVDNVSLLLKLSIGNSEKYLRFTNSGIFSLTIHKRTYDVELQISNVVGANIGSAFLNVGKIQSDPFILYKKYNLAGKTLYVNSVTDTYRETPLYFTSNEYGLGSENATAEITDKVGIMLTDELPRLNLSDEIQPTIRIESVAANDTWVVTDSYQVDADYNKNLIILYFLSGNNNSSRIVQYALDIWGQQTNGQNADLVKFCIDGDDLGIYKEKEIKLYVSVREQGVDVISG